MELEKDYTIFPKSLYMDFPLTFDVATQAVYTELYKMHDGRHPPQGPPIPGFFEVKMWGNGENWFNVVVRKLTEDITRVEMYVVVPKDTKEYEKYMEERYPEVMPMLHTVFLQCTTGIVESIRVKRNDPLYGQTYLDGVHELPPVLHSRKDWIHIFLWQQAVAPSMKDAELGRLIDRSEQTVRNERKAFHDLLRGNSNTHHLVNRPGRGRKRK